MTALQTLSTKLCPWLRPALEQLESARRSARLGHAWLIAGPMGIGKINLALVFANRLLGSDSAAVPPLLEPLEALEAIGARHTPADHHPDLHWLHAEEDKHSISVDQVRGAIGALALTAHRGAAKVVVVEPADAMTTAAANALLKTLEEPSNDTYLLLLSHQPGGLPATIRSRCQRLNVARPPANALASWLGTVDATTVAQASAITGGIPLTTAALLHSKESFENNILTDNLSAVSEDKRDPLALAEAWAKGDAELALTWLTRALYHEIQQRLGAGGSTPVTDQSVAKLHNAWRHLTLGTLFDQYRSAEQLLSRLGSGLNLELALQALLVGFQVNRGR